MSVRLFIGNLPYTATEAELREHLSSVGVPTSVVLPVDRETGRPRGFAFVDYADRAVAEEAIRKFDQAPFKGRGLAVSEARPREERGPGGPPRPGGFSPRPRAARAASAHRDPAADPAATRRGPAASRRGPGGFGGGEAPRGNKNFGPDAPPKHKRKPQGKERDKPEGPDQAAADLQPLRRRRGLARARRAGGRARHRQHRDPQGCRRRRRSRTMRDDSDDKETDEE